MPKAKSNGGPGGARTPNPQFRRLMLYPIELQGRDFSDGERVATPDELPSRSIRREGLTKIWGGKRESNPQPSEPQSGALPVELFPPLALIIATAVPSVRPSTRSPKLGRAHPTVRLTSPRAR